MPQPVRLPAIQPGDQSLIPETHMVKGENELLTIFTLPPQMLHGTCMYMHTNKHTYTK